MSWTQRFRNLWWPAAVPELSLDAWRSALTSYTLRIVMLGGGLMLAAVWVSFGLDEFHPLLVFAAAVYVGLLVVLRLVRTARARAYVLFYGCLVVAPVFLAQSGPAPAPLLLLLLPCVLAALLIGQSAGVRFLVFSFLLLFASSALHLTRPEHLGKPLDLRVHGELRMWFRTGLTWFMITGWLVYVASWLTTRMDQALRLKSQALDAAHHEHARREVADLQRRATEDVLIEAQRHEALGRITGSVSHDFNNALFVILGWNDLLSRPEASVEQRRVGHAAIAAAGRNAAELARRLVTMSHGAAGDAACVEPRPVLEDAVRYLSRLLPENVRVTSAIGNMPKVALSGGELQQLVLNLALEARDRMPAGGGLAVRLVNAGASAPAPVLLELLAEPAAHPDGAAVPPPASGRVALAAARAIVTRCGGVLEVSEDAAVPAHFCVWLPLAGADAGSDRVLPSRPRPAERTARILVVEDDPAVRELMVVALRSRGHEVFEAADGDEALRFLEEPRGELFLCIDGVIPGAPSTAIIARFRALQPGRPILVCSGYLGTPQLQALVQDERLPFLPKPFTPEELAEKVQELLADSSPGSNPGAA